MIHSELVQCLDSWFPIWLESGREGLFKIAGLLDARMELIKQNQSGQWISFYSLNRIKKNLRKSLRGNVIVKKKPFPIHILPRDMMASRVLGNDTMKNHFHTWRIAPIDVKDCGYTVSDVAGFVGTKYARRLSLAR